MSPELETPEPASTQPAPRYASLLIVALVAMIAGIAISANLDKFSWPVRAAADVASPPSDEAAKAGGGADDLAYKPEPVSRAGESAEDKAPDLSGAWTLTNRIESANNAAFKGLALGFQLKLQQRGDRVTGAGAKVTENGKPLAAGRRTPITVEGTLDGRRLQLTFTERGAQRASTGQLSLELTGDGTLRGEFTSDAANARGTSVAQRAK
jgi:hypothetical protein